MEYGLGIFIAGIDEDSVADRSAVMVGLDMFKKIFTMRCVRLFVLM